MAKNEGFMMGEEYPLAKKGKPLEGEVVEPDKFREVIVVEGVTLLHAGSRGLLYRPPIHVDSTAKVVEPSKFRNIGELIATGYKAGLVTVVDSTAKVVEPEEGT